MKTRTETLKDIEPANLESRCAEFADDGAKEIKVQRQPDGRYTVVAIVPAGDAKP